MMHWTSQYMDRHLSATLNPRLPDIRPHFTGTLPFLSWPSPPDMFKLVHYETQLASGQLVSYWNAFLLLIDFSTSAGLRKQNLILNDRVVNASVLHRRFVWSHLRHTNVLDLLFTLFQNTLDSGVLIVHGTITISCGAPIYQKFIQGSF